MMKDTQLELDAKGSLSPVAADSRKAQRSLVGVFKFKRLASSVNVAVGSGDPRSLFSVSSLSIDGFS